MYRAPLTSTGGTGRPLPQFAAKAGDGVEPGELRLAELGRQVGAAMGAAITIGAASQPPPKGLTAQTTAATADATRAFGAVEHISTGGATTRSHAG